MLKNKNVLTCDDNVFIPADLNFGRFILDKMWTFRNNVCWINGATDEKITYGETAQQTMNVAVSLSHIGVRKGQTIAIFSENRNEFFSAALGVICVGGVLTTINVGYAKAELIHVLNISKPSYIFCSPFTYKTHKDTLKSLKFIKKIILFGTEAKDTVSFNALAIPSNENFENGELVFDKKSKRLLRNIRYEEFLVPDVMGQTDTLLILYSSGTTGLPKGVMLTHLNVLTSCCLPSSHDPSFLSLTITPWFHVMGLVGNLTALTTGRCAVYLTRFEMDLYLKVIDKYRIIQLTVVPPVLVALCKADIKYDVSSVQLIYSGAAPLHKDTLTAVNKKFPGATVLQGYGMTEVTLAVTRDTYNKANISKPGSVGRVVSGCTVKVADLQTGQPLGPNQRGEICVKGPLLMKGYINRSSGDDYDGEGYFRTGDIGYYDEDGCFFIVDRLKELIKYKAYQVPPAEIEAVLLQHEGLKDAGVVGKAHPDAGEVPVAFVVKKPDVDVTKDDVVKFVAERLSNPKHLRGGVIFIEQIPKNPSGKILRKNLKIMLNSRQSKL